MSYAVIANKSHSRPVEWTYRTLGQTQKLNHRERTNSRNGSSKTSNSPKPASKAKKTTSGILIAQKTLSVNESLRDQSFAKQFSRDRTSYSTLLQSAPIKASGIKASIPLKATHFEIDVDSEAQILPACQQVTNSTFLEKYFEKKFLKRQACRKFNQS